MDNQPAARLAACRDKLHTAAESADVVLAAELIGQLQRLAGTAEVDSKFEIACETPASCAQPTTFTVSVTHVRWLTRHEMQTLMAYSPTDRIAALWTEPRSQRVTMRVYYNCVPRAERLRERFEPLPPNKRKKMQADVKWNKSRVHNADDIAFLGKLFDELYNVRDRLPLETRGWIEPIESREAQRRAIKKEDDNDDVVVVAEDELSSDDAGSTGHYYRRGAAGAGGGTLVGYCVRVRRFPGVSAAFIEHLWTLFGARRMQNCLWIARASSTASVPISDSAALAPALSRAHNVYGGVGETIVKAALGSEGESELALMVASSTAGAHLMVADFAAHPATQAPYQRAREKAATVTKRKRESSGNNEKRSKLV